MISHIHKTYSNLSHNLLNALAIFKYNHCFIYHLIKIFFSLYFILKARWSQRNCFFIVNINFIMFQKLISLLWSNCILKSVWKSIVLILRTLSDKTYNVWHFWSKSYCCTFIDRFLLFFLVTQKWSSGRNIRILLNSFFPIKIFLSELLVHINHWF
jgi:hypothetical protein